MGYSQSAYLMGKCVDGETKSAINSPQMVNKLHVLWRK